MRQLLDVANTLTLQEIHDFEMRFAYYSYWTLLHACIIILLYYYVRRKTQQWLGIFDKYETTDLSLRGMFQVR